MNDNDVKYSDPGPEFMGLVDSAHKPNVDTAELLPPPSKPRPVRLKHIVSGQNILIVADNIDDTESYYEIVGLCPACACVMIKDK